MSSFTIGNLNFHNIHFNDIKPNTLLITYYNNTPSIKRVSNTQPDISYLSLERIELILSVNSRSSNISNDPTSYMKVLVLFSKYAKMRYVNKNIVFTVQSLNISPFINSANTNPNSYFLHQLIPLF